MRKFEFNLQRVLDYRESIEEKLLGELAAVRAEHDREVGKLTAMMRARDSFRKKMKRQLSAGSPDEIRTAYFYLNDLVRQIQSQEVNVMRAAEQKNRKTAEVVEASKDRKVMERLRDYKIVEHRVETQAQDQKFLDDLSSIRTNRARSRAADGGHA